MHAGMLRLCMHGKDLLWLVRIFYHVVPHPTSTILMPGLTVSHAGTGTRIGYYHTSYQLLK
jgi:hypothetical protein